MSRALQGYCLGDHAFEGAHHLAAEGMQAVCLYGHENLAMGVATGPLGGGGGGGRERVAVFPAGWSLKCQASLPSVPCCHSRAHGGALKASAGIEMLKFLPHLRPLCLALLHNTSLSLMSGKVSKVQMISGA